MTMFAYPHRATSFVRSTVVFVAVAAMGYVAGTVLHIPAAANDVSTVFAPPARAATPNFRVPTAEDDSFPPERAIEWGLTDGELIAQPRECDLPKGVSVACLFMD